VWLGLLAGNQELATRFYEPLGFVIVPGEEHKFRPSTRRKPHEAGQGHEWRTS
jgi:hypothetical protein